MTHETLNNHEPAEFKIFTLISIVPKNLELVEKLLEDILRSGEIFENSTVSKVDHKFVPDIEIIEPTIKSNLTLSADLLRKIEIGLLHDANQIPVLVIKANIKCKIDKVPEIAAFFYDPENEYQINEKNVQEYLADKKYHDYRLSMSRHQIIFSSVAIPPNEVQNLMMKGNHDFKPESIAIHSVKELASLKDTEVFVWDTNTLTWGWENHSIGTRRIHEILFNAAATTASETALKEIRYQTIKLIDVVSKASAIENNLKNVKEARQQIRHFEEKLSNLRIQLAVAAEWPRSSDMVVGGKPLERYSKILYSEIDFDYTLDITAKMHDKIAQIIANIRTSLDSEILINNNEKQQEIAESTRKLLYKTDSVQAIGLIATAIITIVSVTTLFATLAAIPHDGLFRPAVKNIATAGLIVLFGAFTGYTLHLNRKLAKKPSRYFKYFVSVSSATALILFTLSFFLDNVRSILIVDSLGLFLILSVIFVGARYTNESE